MGCDEGIVIEGLVEVVVELEAEAEEGGEEEGDGEADEPAKRVAQDDEVEGPAASSPSRRGSRKREIGDVWAR